MKAKANQFISPIRTVRVPLTFEDDEGNRQTEEFVVKYRSLSPKLAREMREVENEESETRGLAKSLSHLIVCIPDITGEGEQPLDLNEENLNQMSQDNLKALYNGIVSDISPTMASSEKPNSEGSPSTSAPTAVTG